MDVRDLDTIHIHRLSLPFPILAPNVWGDIKAQPAFISLDLQLRTGFGSTAQRDRLDSSTVHYGVLAKRIRAACREGLSFEELLGESFEAVQKLTGGTLAKCKILIELPKGSMLGERVEVVEQKTYRAEVVRERSLRFVGVRVPVLIGVNDYERTAKQPLVVDLTADLTNETVWRELFGLESHVVEVIGGTSFETLETLIEFTIKQLRDKILDRLLPGGRIILRVQKPMAIAFADAPIIEVLRHIPTTKSLATGPTGGDGTETSTPDVAVSMLTISKPYQGKGL